MNSVADIHHSIYINLERRTDRKEMVLTEFSKLDWVTDPICFKAVEMKNGAVGCYMSHIKCLELAKSRNWPHIMICEDDIKFTDPMVFTENLNKFLSSGIEWDVILLAGNNGGDYFITNMGAVKIKACQTTTGYLVKSEYYDTLIETYREGVAKLLRSPENKFQYAIDKYWNSLQVVHNWYLIYPLTVTQQPIHSDIENKVVNYDVLMLNLDKKKLFKGMSYSEIRKLIYN